jgi:energy-coupling factor transport system substrate-specific component
MKVDRAKIGLAFALAGVNVGIGVIVSTFKLPVYLDSIGIIVSTLVLGWRYGALCSLITVVAGFLFITPYLPAYLGTSLGVVFATNILRRQGMFRNAPLSFASGVVIGLVAAVLSAPVTVILFEGNTLAGADIITAFLRTTGQTLWNSVVISGLTSELVDKPIAASLAFAAVQSIPKRYFKAFHLRPLTPDDQEAHI